MRFKIKRIEFPWLLWLMLPAAAAAAVLRTGPETFTPSFTPDSASYLLAGHNLAAGTLDALRTPLYPLLLNLIGIDATVCLQWCLFLLSIPLLGYILRKEDVSTPLIIIIQGLYALPPSMGLMASAVLTDSLSTSFSVLLILLALRTARRPSLPAACALALTLIILIGLRPSALLWILSLGLGAIVLFMRRSSRSAQAWLVSAITAAIAAGAYVAVLRESSHSFAPSSVTDVNELTFQLHTARLRSEPIDSATFPLHSRLQALEYRNGPQEAAACLQSIASSAPRYLAAEVMRYRARNRDASIFQTRSQAIIHSATTCKDLWGLGFLWILATIGFLRAIHTSSPLDTGWRIWLWLSYSAALLMVICTAPGEYHRLMLPFIPAALILVSLVFPRPKNRVVWDDVSALEP